MSRKYYTLEDLYKSYGTDQQKLYSLDLSTPYKDSTTTLFYDLIYASICNEDYEPPESDNVLRGDESNILFCSYIYPRYRKCAVAYSDDELAGEELNNLYISWLVHYVNILRRTFDEYTKLIDLFDDIKENLLDDIKILSISKFNDTPQAEDAGFEADNYVSNISTNETSNPLATKMARLKEVENSIIDYYEKWANEFKRVFFYE